MGGEVPSFWYYDRRPVKVVPVGQHGVQGQVLVITRYDSNWILDAYNRQRACDPD